MSASQSIVSNLLEEEENARPLPFIGSATLDMGAEQVAADVRAALQFDLDAFRQQTTARDAFGYLRERIESVGIFVLLQCDLGSHHTTIPAAVFRGFTLADAIAPYIVINRQDAVAAWSVTALHECAHLWLGQSGISGGYSEREIERFCDRTAAAILLPAAELDALPRLENTPLEAAAAAITDFADARHVSRTMVAFNLRRRGEIGRARWDGLRRRFYGEWREARQLEAERNGLTLADPVSMSCTEIISVPRSSTLPPNPLAPGD